MNWYQQQTSFFIEPQLAHVQLAGLRTYARSGASVVWSVKIYLLSSYLIWPHLRLLLSLSRVFAHCRYVCFSVALQCNGEMSPPRSEDVIYTQAWADGDAAHSSWLTADGYSCGFYHAVLLLCLRHQVQNVMITPLSWIPQVYFNQNKFGRHIFEDLECNNKYPNLSHLSHANGKYLIWKRECENKYLTCANKSQSSLTSVPESWAGSKTSISWPVSDSTPGAGSVFGTHEHRSLWSTCLPGTKPFFRHKLLLLRRPLYVFKSHESKYS